MSNLEKYKKIFKECFSVNEDVVEELHYQGVAEWDSVGHMDLVATIEDEFDVMLETDEIIGLDSFLKGMEMLKNHVIEF